MFIKWFIIIVEVGLKAACVESTFFSFGYKERLLLSSKYVEDIINFVSLW